MENSQMQRSKKRVPEKSRESVLSNMITLALTGDLIEFKNR